MVVKREMTKVESNDSPPKRAKVKTEATTSPAKRQRTYYTVEDAQLMKKLREEQNLSWE
jgi:hypothetical protein